MILLSVILTFNNKKTYNNLIANFNNLGNHRTYIAQENNTIPTNFPFIGLILKLRTKKSKNRAQKSP